MHLSIRDCSSFSQSSVFSKLCRVPVGRLSGRPLMMTTHTEEEKGSFALNYARRNECGLRLSENISPLIVHHFWGAHFLHTISFHQMILWLLDGSLWSACRLAMDAGRWSISCEYVLQA